MKRATVSLTKTELKAAVKEAVLEALAEAGKLPAQALKPPVEMTAPPPQVITGEVRSYQIPALPYLKNMATTGNCGL